MRVCTVVTTPHKTVLNANVNAMPINQRHAAKFKTVQRLFVTALPCHADWVQYPTPPPIQLQVDQINL